MNYTYNMRICGVADGSAPKTLFFLAEPNELSELSSWWGLRPSDKEQGVATTPAEERV